MKIRVNIQLIETEFQLIEFLNDLYLQKYCQKLKIVEFDNFYLNTVLIYLPTNIN